MNFLIKIFLILICFFIADYAYAEDDLLMPKSKEIKPNNIQAPEQIPASSSSLNPTKNSTTTLNQNQNNIQSQNEASHNLGSESQINPANKINNIKVNNTDNNSIMNNSDTTKINVNELKADSENNFKNHDDLLDSQSTNIFGFDGIDASTLAIKFRSLMFSEEQLDKLYGALKKKKTQPKITPIISQDSVDFSENINESQELTELVDSAISNEFNNKKEVK
jgi:hypothetical protein